jgi:hypothetical protein
MMWISGNIRIGLKKKKEERGKEKKGERKARMRREERRGDEKDEGRMIKKGWR